MAEEAKKLKIRAHSYDEHLALKQQRIVSLCGVCDDLKKDIGGKGLMKDENGRYLLTLEIGCGHGHWLTAYAEKTPNMLCIGMDIITKRIDKANAKKEKRGLGNLYFYKAEFSEIIEAFKEKEFLLKNVVILFPDPWPKKRHFKNRLMNDFTLETLAKRSADETTLYFRTDHLGYFDWTEDIFRNSALWVQNDETKWLFEQETFFQEMMDSYNSLSAKLR
tara:strand:- start:47 stop:706 length:660 start_codon:yes stop_codon:yes gene_type:complete